jgi:hypothetical protein
VLLFQLDDLGAAAVQSMKPAAFLILTTSQGNHQAWLAVEGWSDIADFGWRLKKAAGADPSASGATRVAGTVNFKRKYEPDFPTVIVLEARAGGIVRAQSLDALGLVAAADDPVREISAQFRHAGDKWPSYEGCVEGAPPAHNNSDQRDISRADFTWCVIAADWGNAAPNIAGRLMQLSTKAKENGEAYATLTAQRAVAVVRARR